MRILLRQLGPDFFLLSKHFTEGYASNLCFWVGNISANVQSDHLQIDDFHVSMSRQFDAEGQGLGLEDVGLKKIADEQIELFMPVQIAGAASPFPFLARYLGEPTILKINATRVIAVWYSIQYQDRHLPIVSTNMDSHWRLIVEAIVNRGKPFFVYASPGWAYEKRLLQFPNAVMKEMERNGFLLTRRGI